MYAWQSPDLEFEYLPTEHPCPTCGQGLLLVEGSTMLVCNEDHGPFFLT